MGYQGKSENANLDVVIQIHNAQFVLLANSMAGLIQYFDGSHWTSQVRSSTKSPGKSATVCWKVEVKRFGTVFVSGAKQR